MVKIVFSLKTIYFIIGIFILILAGVGVYAFQTTGDADPLIMGHTLNEFRPSCTGILTSTGTDNSWSCIDTPVSCTGTDKLLQYNPLTEMWGCVTASP